jgi:hypothetical protein
MAAPLILYFSGPLERWGTGREMTSSPEAGPSCHTDTVADDAPLAVLRLTGRLAGFAFLGMVNLPFDGRYVVAAR